MTTIGTSSPPLAQQSLEENLTRCLIEAVKNEPCLYNPSNEHYDNLPSNVAYRSRVWQKLCAKLGFKGDVRTLQMHWKNICEQYVRENSKSNDGVISSEQKPTNCIDDNQRLNDAECSTSDAEQMIDLSQYFDMLHWLNPFISKMAIDRNPQRLDESSAPTVLSAVSPQADQPSQKGEMLAATTSENNSAKYFLHRAEEIGPAEVKQKEIAVNNQNCKTSAGCSLQSEPLDLQTQYDYATASQNCNLINGSIINTKQSVKHALMIDKASPASSTSSEIDVGTSCSSVPPVSLNTGQQPTPSASQLQQLANSTLAATQSMQRPTTSQTVQQVLFSKSETRSKIGQQIQTADGGVLTVTAKGTAPIGNVIKRDVNIRTNDGGTVTMIIDPTTFYQHGTQKMYRLVNVSQLNADMLPLNTTNASSVCTADGIGGGEVKIVSMQPRRKRMATVNLQNVPNGRGQLGDDLILDDGISEKTVTIEQSCTLLDNVSAGPALRSTLNLNSPVQNQQIATTSLPHGSIASTQHVTVSPQNPTQSNLTGIRLQQQQQNGQRFVTQAVAIQHPQYMVYNNQSSSAQRAEDLAFANSIANHLARLNEDEKAVAKMNIQRILMDARFGVGACARMIHDDDLSSGDSAAATNVAPHEMIGTQHVNSSRR